MFLRRMNFLVFLQIFVFGTAYSQITIYEKGPVNEAYLPLIGGENLVLDAISVQPPEPINERIPPQTDPQTEWIPGYWSWQNDLNDFVWVSGIWRKPPPGHLWISGFWKKFEEGWAWVHGFWNEVPENNIQYIGIAPPDAIDENVPPPPNNNYVWNPGYWYFLFDKNEYQFVSGNWEELDPNLILTPAHYVWRPGGYVFVPTYWDWPLEQRGTAFAAAKIEREYRYRADFQPSQVIEPTLVIQNYFPYYPNYITVFQHHYRYHPEFWESCKCAPSWWGWETWWSFNWRDQWALWWWYTHPGYPQPVWMTPQLSSIIAPPAVGVVVLNAKINPPDIIGPYGVVTRKQLLEASSKVSGRFAPILPSDRKNRDKIYVIAKPSTKDNEIIRPNGKQLPYNPAAQRPSVRKPVIDSGRDVKITKISDERKPKLPLKPRKQSADDSRLIQSRQIPGHERFVRRSAWNPGNRNNSVDINDYQNGSEGYYDFGNQGYQGSYPYRREGQYIWNPQFNGGPDTWRRPGINQVQRGRVEIRDVNTKPMNPILSPRIDAQRRAVDRKVQQQREGTPPRQ